LHEPGRVFLSISHTNKNFVASIARAAPAAKPDGVSTILLGYDSVTTLTGQRQGENRYD
jgi:hypothetical protein